MSIDKLLARAAKEIQPNMKVNLGIGLPTKILDYLDDDLPLLIHSENGILGAWKKTSPELAEPQLIDAGGQYVSTVSGASFFDSAVSFAMIRRGKLDLSILGTFEVDQEGSLANWKIPGKFSPGIGGAMELAQKTPQVLVLCTHNDKAGCSKILKQCRLPITASHCVSRIITDKAVMDVTEDGLLLKEVVAGLTVEQVVRDTEAELILAETIETF